MQPVRITCPQTCPDIERYGGFASTASFCLKYRRRLPPSCIDGGLIRLPRCISDESNRLDRQADRD